MASDLYLTKLTLSSNDWYVGLDVTYTCRIGCWNGACANCYAALNIGLSSASDCDCGSAPSGWVYFAYEDVSVACGSEKNIYFTHKVTQGDIDYINAGRSRACALISQGMANNCYERTSVRVVDPPSMGLITKYEYPVEAQVGKTVNVFVDVKNTGSGWGSFYLDLMDGPEAIHRESLGSIAAGASVYNTHLWGTMPNRDWNLSIELWRV